MIQWLRFQASTVGGADLIPGQGTKILHAEQCAQKYFLKKGREKRY